MRSIHVSMLALALTTLLCACVSRVPVWETVDDEFVCQHAPPTVHNRLCRARRLG